MNVEDLNRFFKAKNVTRSCPACGTDAWKFQLDPAAGAHWVLSAAQETAGASRLLPAIPVVVLTCGNCYMVQTHASKIIETWLKENPAGEVGK